MGSREIHRGGQGPRSQCQRPLLTAHSLQPPQSGRRAPLWPSAGPGSTWSQTRPEGACSAAHLGSPRPEGPAQRPGPAAGALARQPGRADPQAPWTPRRGRCCPGDQFSPQPRRGTSSSREIATCPWGICPEERNKELPRSPLHGPHQIVAGICGGDFRLFFMRTLHPVVKEPFLGSPWVRRSEASWWNKLARVSRGEGEAGRPTAPDGRVAGSVTWALSRALQEE